MPMNPFDGWDPVPSAKLFAYPPAFYTPRPGQLDLFAVDSSGQLQHNFADVGLRLNWTRWQVMVNGAVGTAAAVVGPLAIEITQDVFVVGVDSAVWHVSGNQFTWSSATSLGGMLRPDLSAVRTDLGQIHVFGRGLDGRLWHLFVNDSKPSWEQREGMILSAPSVVAWSPTELQMVALGPNSDLLHQWYSTDTGTWSGWESLGGTLSSPPVIVAPSPQRLDVFARGTDGSLQHRYWDGESWGTRFTPLGGGDRLSAGPSVSALNDPERIDVIVALLNHSAGRVYWDGKNWGTITSQGGLFASSPLPTLTPSSTFTQLDMLAYSVYGTFYTQSLRVD